MSEADDDYGSDGGDLDIADEGIFYPKFKSALRGQLTVARTPR